MNTIDVTLNESDMEDFLSDGFDPEQTRRAIRQYCRAYAVLIGQAFPEARVTVDTGQTPMGTVVRVDGERRTPEAEDVARIVTNLGDRLVNDWSWLDV